MKFDETFNEDNVKAKGSILTLSISDKGLFTFSKSVRQKHKQFVLFHKKDKDFYIEFFEQKLPESRVIQLRKNLNSYSLNSVELSRKIRRILQKQFPLKFELERFDLPDKERIVYKLVLRTPKGIAMVDEKLKSYQGRGRSGKIG